MRFDEESAIWRFISNARLGGGLAAVRNKLLKARSEDLRDDWMQIGGTTKAISWLHKTWLRRRGFFTLRRHQSKRVRRRHPCRHTAVR